MNRRKLPTGIQTFREIREDDCYYVDKTDYALRLADEGKHYFLSRPRRFGKSLFLDTLKELFEGSEELFRGLAVHQQWHWDAPHPVVRLSFAKGNFKTPGYLHTNTMVQLERVARRASVPVAYDTAPERFGDLIETLHERTQRRVTVLVDEYDKPILDALGDSETATANRDYLRGLYSTIKDCDADVQFSFLTGVSKFPKTGLFSTVNQFTDLTLEPAFSTICGYTEQDLEQVFAPELPQFDRDKMRTWYNGYSWGGEETVYNPYDVLLLFRRGRFENHWYRTGTPEFLVKMLLERGIDELGRVEGTTAGEDRLSAFDIGRIDTAALMFQTGYLTIKETLEGDGDPQYRLGYPNEEVRRSVNKSLLNALTRNPSENEAETLGRRLKEALAAADYAGLRAALAALYAAMPYEQRIGHSRQGEYEGHYVALAGACAKGAGVEVVMEESGSRGRADVTMKWGARVYVFEFKLVDGEATGEALAQAQAKEYAEKYRHLGPAVHYVGVEIGRRSCDIVGFEAEPAFE